MPRKATTKKKPAKKARKPKRQRRTKSDTFAWDLRKEQAAQLLAEHDLTADEIAAKVGVVRSTLYEWQTHADFAARVEEVTARLGHISERRVIARRGRRLLALEDRWLRMQKVIEERAADPDHQRAPGGSTGLLVRKERMIGSGDNAMLIEEFEVDTALLKELRETEKQAAQEAGQWTEKHEHSGPDGKPIQAKVTHDVAADLQPYADAIRTFLGGSGALPPDGDSQPLDTAQAEQQTGAVPPA